MFSTNLVYTLNLLYRIPSYRKWSLWTNRTVQGRQLFITLHKAGSSRWDLFLFPSSFIFLFLLFLSFPFHFFLQSVLLLLKNGTDPSIKNNTLETPLHLSARYSRHIKQQGYSWAFGPVYMRWASAVSRDGPFYRAAWLMPCFHLKLLLLLFFLLEGGRDLCTSNRDLGKRASLPSHVSKTLIIWGNKKTETRHEPEPVWQSLPGRLKGLANFI